MSIRSSIHCFRASYSLLQTDRYYSEFENRRETACGVWVLGDFPTLQGFIEKELFLLVQFVNKWKG